MITTIENNLNSSQPSRFESIFVGNLSYFCQSDHLLALFSPFGTIQSAVVCKAKNKDPLYYGFVNMISSPGVEVAINSLSNIFFMGRKLKVMRSSRGSNDQSAQSNNGNQDIEQGYQLLVSFVSSSFGENPSNPPLVVNEECLFHVFSKFGIVLDVLVKQYSYTTSSQNLNQINHNQMVVIPSIIAHKQCGYGFVLFQDWEAAHQAMNMTKADPQGEQSMGIKLDCRLSTLTAQKVRREGRVLSDDTPSTPKTPNTSSSSPMIPIPSPGSSSPMNNSNQLFFPAPGHADPRFIQPPSNFPYPYPAQGNSPMFGPSASTSPLPPAAPLQSYGTNNYGSNSIPNNTNANSATSMSYSPILHPSQFEEHHNHLHLYHIPHQHHPAHPPTHPPHPLHLPPPSIGSSFSSPNIVSSTNSNSNNTANVGTNNTNNNNLMAVAAPPMLHPPPSYTGNNSNQYYTPYYYNPSQNQTQNHTQSNYSSNRYNETQNNGSNNNNQYTYNNQPQHQSQQQSQQQSQAPYPPQQPYYPPR